MFALFSQYYHVFVIGVCCFIISSSSFFIITIDSRSTGPPLISQQRGLPKSISQINFPSFVNNNFPHYDFRFAFLLPDDERAGDQPQTSSTTSATTATIMPTTSSSVATSTTLPSSSNQSSTSTSTTSTTTTITTTMVPTTTTVPTSTPAPPPLPTTNNPLLTFPSTDFYQIIILTSSQILAYRVSDFSASSSSFSSSLLLWEIGRAGDRTMYRDGNHDQVRLRDPTSAVSVYSYNDRRQRFPFPEFRGFVWTERGSSSSCAIRFLNFEKANGLSDNKQRPNLVRTIAGIPNSNCGAEVATTSNEIATNVRLTSPSGLSPKMTSGGLLFVTDDTCLRVLHNFDKFLDHHADFYYNDSISVPLENRIRIDTFAGDCTSGGASEGNVIDFARFYQLEHVTFDQGESVLFLAQRFGFMRKIWPMPRNYQDVVSMKKYAVSVSISSQLLPGTIHQILWSNPSSKYPQFHDSSIFIVSGGDTVETNATNTDAVGEEPLYLPLSPVPLFSQAEFSDLKTIVMLPNGSAIAFSSNVVESKASFLFFQNEQFFPFDATEYYFPGRPSLSVSISQSIEETLTHEETISPTESPTFPTPQKTASKTHPRTFSRATTESLSHSDPTPSDGHLSPTLPTRTLSETEHYITPSVSETIYFFRPQSIIPRNVMRIYIIRTALAFGFVGGMAGAAPPNAMVATRLVNAFDSCDCPTLPVTKIDETLKYFTGLTFGVADDFLVPIDVIDSKLQESYEKENNGEVGQLLANEKIIPRIRAVIVMHFMTSLVIAPPVLFGLRVVDGFVATDGMPAAFRLGLISVVVSVWFQGALAASVCLLLLTPDPGIEAVIIIVPHLLFCLLSVVIVPIRLTRNAMNVEPRPHLEEIVYDDYLSADELAALDAQEQKKNKMNKEKEESQRVIDFDDVKEQEKVEKEKLQKQIEKENEEKKKKHDERMKRKIGCWESFIRYCRGKIQWQPPYSDSFPRSFPLVHPIVATSPTSFSGWLFMVHVFVSIGLSIIDGYRIAQALRNASFSMGCTWYLEMSSALIVGLFAVIMIILQVKYTKSHGGAFISPPTTIGHFLAIFFNAAAKCLQVACSFAHDLWYVESEDFTPNRDAFKSKLVSAADVCVLFATVGLVIACLPLMIRVGQIVSSKMKDCAVNVQEAATHSHRLTLNKKEKDGEENQQNNITNEELAMHLTEKGQLWRMLDKMEKKRIAKPEHLDLLRRPLVNKKNKSFSAGYAGDDQEMFSSLLDDDEDDYELSAKTRTAEILGMAAASSSTKKNKNTTSANQHDDDINLEGASVHNNDAGKLDTMERYALLLRTERIDEWNKQQKFLRAQAKAEQERRQREEEAREEEERLHREFLEKEAAERDGSFVVDLL